MDKQQQIEELENRVEKLEERLLFVVKVLNTITHSEDQEGMMN